MIKILEELSTVPYRISAQQQSCRPPGRNRHVVCGNEIPIPKEKLMRFSDSKVGTVLFCVFLAWCIPSLADTGSSSKEASFAEPMVKKTWEERPSTEEVTEGIEAALAIPNWKNSGPAKSSSPWRQAGLGIVDEDVSSHDKSGRIRCSAWAWDAGLGETTLYIGTSSGGLFKLGRNPIIPIRRMWVPISWNLPGSPSVGAFLVHSQNSNRILIGTGDRGRGYDVGTGLYRTEIGGTSWSKVAMSPQPGVFDKIVADINDPTGNTVYASTDTGVWHSTNFGITWTRVYTGAAGSGVTDLVQHPSGAPWYIGVPGAGVIRCNIPGDACLADSGIADPVARVSITVSQSDPDWVFALVSGSNTCSESPYGRCSTNSDCAGASNLCSRYVSGLLNGIYRSGDGGANFSRIESRSVDGFSGGQGFHAHTLAVDPRNPDRLMVGMAGVQMSYNATAADPTDVCWRRNVGWSDPGWCTLTGSIDIGHGDQTSMNFVPDTVDPGNSRIIVTNDGGISDYNFSTNTMDDWYNEIGPNISQTYGGAIARAVNHPDRLLIGTQDNGTIRIDLEETKPYTYVPTWPSGSGADGGPVSINPGNSDYLGTSTGMPYGRELSISGGTTWTNIDANLPQTWAPAVRFHRKPGYASVFSSDAGSYVYYRFPWDDPTADWTHVNPTAPFPSGVAISNVEVGRSDTSVIYVTDSKSAENGTAALYVLEEGVTGGDIGSMGWEDRTPTNLGSNPVNEGLVSPDRSTQLSDHVYFVTGGNRPSRAFLSPNRGDAWFEVTGDLDGVLDNVSFWHLVAHPFDHSQLFLATETGVYRTDGGLHWYRYMDGLPEVVKARGLEIHATTPDDAHLVLATWGHGVWEKDVEFQDYLFSGGFENGSTLRWSETVGGAP